MGVRSLFHHMTHFVQFCFKLIHQQIHIPNKKKIQKTNKSFEMFITLQKTHHIATAYKYKTNKRREQYSSFTFSVENI